MTILQHPRSPVNFDPPPDPRDPDVLDRYPSPSVVERAKAAQLCERANALDAAQPEHRADLLRVMDKPSYLELQAEESSDIEHIADVAAKRLHGRSLDLLPRQQQAQLRDNAAVFVRMCHQPWVKYGQQMAVMAVDGLLTEDLKKALPHLTEAHWHGLSTRIVGRVYGAWRNALASINGISPGTYLRICGQCKAEDASR